MASDSERREEKHPWSGLPRDLLQLMFKKLRLFSDCIRFGAVCKSWRLASQSTPASSQLPLLLLLDQHFTESRSFFSLSTNSIHTLSLPKLRLKKILASSHGWLLLVDMATMVISLLNPITEAQIQLPTLRRPNDCTEILSPEKGVISSSPSSAEHDCVVITIRSCIFITPCIYRANDVNFCRPGRDEVWTKLKTPPCLDSIVYNKGRFYMNFIGVVTVHDAAAPSVKILSVPAPSLAIPSFLVKASETELLWCGYDDLSRDDEKILRLFKMDLNGRVLEWSEIDSIGDKALFLTQDNCSCSMICARDLPGCKEDCVYDQALFDDYLDVIKIKDGSYKRIRIPCALEVPIKDLSAPTWFTPSLY